MSASGSGIKLWLVAGTLATGLAGGVAFFLLHIPLPWVLGSLTATALMSRTGLRQGLPQPWRGFAMVVIGTMLGAGFTADVASAFILWLPSIAIMCALSILFWALTLAALRRWGNMSAPTAMLSAVPGGLSVVTSIAEDYGGDVRRIALSHTARLITLLVLTPIMLGWVSDYDLAAASRAALVTHDPFDVIQLALLTACAVIGFTLARLVRMPSGLLILPLVFSALAHATDIVTIQVPGPVSILAQVIIGASAGTRFTGYRLSDIGRDGWISVVIGIALALTSMVAAWAVTHVFDLAIAPLLLSYLPGGAPELGVVSLAIQADPAMVAVHHVARVFLLLSLIPVALRGFLPDSRV